ncbi:hypothetical protein HPO96_33975 [Kribbella sandramycini]|uniref:Uncharacterized protein n=1 Tax=Kribbella sandramycini TaxID=60450 RepID=A0A7Y4L6L6_9ACTN|nr:hypothetical protein [Kribbella sandramycini]MBB6570407.1 hypothetical protein [Kribbella sandramycini]NOL45268.1 hypothetical protein [Kribbella sandramycini]
MAEYLVAPLEEPEWVLEVDEFAEALRARWPGVRVGLGSVEGSSVVLEAVVPLEPAPRELGVALSGTRQAVSLDPADAEAAAEFALWMAESVLPGRGLHLIEASSYRTVELTPGMTPEVLLDALG